MSHITRTGNLAAAPELREGEHGPYTYARVIVSDRVKNDDGSYGDGPAVPYELSVSGNQAVQLVDAAKDSGNIRVVFTGDYTVTEYQDRDGNARLSHRVRVDDIGASFRGQQVSVRRPAAD